MRDLSALGLTPEQIEAVNTNEKIKRFLEADKPSEVAALGDNHPHPFKDTISGEAFGLSSDPMNLIMLCAKLGLEEDMYKLFQSAPTQDRLEGISENHFAFFSKLMECSQPHLSATYICMFFTIEMERLEKELAQDDRFLEKPDLNGGFLKKSLESGDYKVIRDALARQDGTTASNLIIPLFGISPKEATALIEKDNFRLFKNLCLHGDKYAIQYLLKFISSLYPEKLSTLIKAVSFSPDIKTDNLSKIHSKLRGAYEDNLSALLSGNDATSSLLLLSQYPVMMKSLNITHASPESKGDCKAAGDPVSAALLREGVEEPSSSTMKNLQLLLVKPKVYKHLMEIERSPSKKLPKAFYKTLEGKVFTDIAELTEVVQEACATAKYGRRKAMVKSRIIGRDKVREDRKAKAAGGKRPKP